MHAIERLPPLRDVVAKHQLMARKSLGQSFLFDLNLTDKIARSAGSLHDHDVLEIGPGPGGLTRSLLKEGARKLVAVEKDRRFRPALEEISAAVPGRLNILQADALQLEPETFLEPPVRIVANLPYNISTALLVRWMSVADWPPFWRNLTLMFQREVAERIVAAPGSKAYGRLSILSQWRTSAAIAFTIPSRAFVPAPKIDSAVVQFERRPKPLHPANRKILFQLVSSAFAQRRKMLRSSLRSLHPDIQDCMAEAGVDPTTRAECVSLGEFCALAREFEQLQRPG